jgi:hypothetical protein
VCREGFGEEDGGVLPANPLELPLSVSTVSSFASSVRVETLVLYVRAAERISKSANAAGAEEATADTEADGEAEMQLAPTPCIVVAAGLTDSLAVEDGIATIAG